MKKILKFSLLLMLLSHDTNLYAQKKVDLGIMMIIINGQTAPYTINANSQYKFGFSVKNFGDSLHMNVNPPDTLWFEYSIAGGALKEAGWLYDFGVPWWKPAAFSGAITDAFTAPNITGNMQICVKVLYPGDMNPTNDKMCIDVKVIGGSGTTSVKEEKQKIINTLFYSNNTLNIHLSNIRHSNGVQLIISNIAGQVMEHKYITTNEQNETIENISLPHLSNGMYFLSIYSDNTIIGHKKFIVH